MFPQSDALGYTDPLDTFMSMGMPPKNRSENRQQPRQQQQQHKSDNELMMESVTSLPSHRSSADNSDALGLQLQPTTSRVQLSSRSPSLMTDDNDDMRSWNEGVKGHQMQPSPRQSNQPPSSSSTMAYGSNSPTSRQIAEQRLLRESVTGNSENMRPMDKNAVSKASPSRSSNKSPRVGSFPMTSDLSDLSAINAGAGGAASVLRRSVDSSISASVDFNKNANNNNNENDDLEDFESLTLNNNNNGNQAFTSGPLTTDTDATGDLTEIDKRIMALQSFLENARSGIFEEGKQ